MGDDRFSESHPFSGIIQGILEGPGSNPQSLGSHRRPAEIQGLHHDGKPHPFPGQEIFGGNQAIFENQFHRFGRADSQFVLVFSHGKSLRSLLHDEHARAFVPPFGRVRQRVNRNGIRHPAVGDKCLLRSGRNDLLSRSALLRKAATSDPPLASVRAKADSFSPGGQGREEFLLLLRTGRQKDGQGPQFLGYRKHPGEASTLDSSSQAIIRERRPGPAPAVFFGEIHPEEAVFPEQLPPSPS